MPRVIQHPNGLVEYIETPREQAEREDREVYQNAIRELQNREKAKYKTFKPVHDLEAHEEKKVKEGR